MDAIHEIKAALRLEALIGETLTVVGRGKTLTTAEHDSLKIWTDRQQWYWFSKGVGGDLIDWYQQLHNCDLRTAIDELGRMAGIEVRKLSAQERQAWEQERNEQRRRDEILAIAAAHYQAALWGPDGQAAREYCAGRGWTEATMKREGLGYSPSPSPLAYGTTPYQGGDGGGASDKPLLSADQIRPLHTKLREAGLLDHPLAKAVLSIPQGYLVYVHRERGRIVYLSARSIVGKRHYNLPEAVAGPKRVYVNSPAGQAAGAALLVEGQADAVALGQIGTSAVGLCGVAGKFDQLPEQISHVAFDNDEAGRAKMLEMALGVDPLCRLVVWPSKVRHREGDHNYIDVKDGADFVMGATGPEDLRTVLDGSLTALEHLAITTAAAKDEERTGLLRQFFSIYESLDTMVATDLKPDLAKHLCGGRVSQFNRLQKANQEEQRASQEKESPERYEYSAGGAVGGLVWEQVITWDALGGGVCMYAVRQPGGKIELQKTVDVGNVTCVPYPANLGVIRNQRIVLFPEKAEEYGNEKQLVREIQGFLHDWFDFGDPFYKKLAAYYILFSWLYDCFENLPYLRALGDYGTGKTRFIQTIGVLCYRPMLVSGASTASPIFRLINMFRGTLVMDEADFANSDAESELIKIINVGYYKGGCVMRAEKEQDTDIYAPETYDVYGPKILATRKPFADRAVESRCLTKRTTTARPRPGIPFMLNDSFWRRSQALRNKLLMYRLRNHRVVEVDEALANDSVEPRLNQVTMALKSIIEDLEMRREIDSFIVAYNENLISDRQMTVAAVLVQALAEIYYTPKTDMLGNDMRDFTMKGIAEQCKIVMEDFDPEAQVYSRLVSKTLSEELGLVRRAKHPVFRRVMVVFEEEELTALMKRYGIERPVR